MLIDSPRLHERDRETWRRLERVDAIHARSPGLARHVLRSRSVLSAFLASAGSAYVGVSWGKDSVVVAHLARRVAPDLPLVWLRSEPGHNPDCLAVRDAFLADFPRHYHEIITPRWRDERGWHSTGTMEAGFAEAERRFGPRHVSGVRATESTARLLRMARWGESTARTCAPIGWWSAADVFAYLYTNGLPVHPAYAMSQGGTWDRERIRVASLGEKHGRGMGRHEWERHYYRRELQAIGEFA